MIVESLLEGWKGDKSAWKPLGEYDQRRKLLESESRYFLRHLKLEKIEAKRGGAEENRKKELRRILIGNIKENRDKVKEKLKQILGIGNDLTSLIAFLDSFSKYFEDAQKSSLYPYSILRSIIDAMRSGCDIEDVGSALDRLIDLIEFALENTIIGSGVSHKALLSKQGLSQEKPERNLIELLLSLFRAGKPSDYCDNSTELIKKGIVIFVYGKSDKKLMVSPAYKPEKEGLKLMLGYSGKIAALKGFKWNSKGTELCEDIKRLVDWSKFLILAYWNIFKNSHDKEFVKDRLKPLLDSCEEDAEKMMRMMNNLKNPQHAEGYCKVRVIWEALSKTLESIKEMTRVA
jgi:hypothetical protein